LFSCEEEEPAKKETVSTGKSGLALKTEISKDYDEVIVGDRVNNAALAGYEGAIYDRETYELVMEIDDFSIIDEVIYMDMEIQK